MATAPEPVRISKIPDLFKGQLVHLLAALVHSPQTEPQKVIDQSRENNKIVVKLWGETARCIINVEPGDMIYIEKGPRPLVLVLSIKVDKFREKVSLTSTGSVRITILWRASQPGPEAITRTGLPSKEERNQLRAWLESKHLAGGPPPPALAVAPPGSWTALNQLHLGELITVRGRVDDFSRTPKHNTLTGRTYIPLQTPVATAFLFDGTSSVRLRVFQAGQVTTSQHLATLEKASRSPGTMVECCGVHCEPHDGWIVLDTLSITQIRILPGKHPGVTAATLSQQIAGHGPPTEAGGGIGGIGGVGLLHRVGMLQEIEGPASMYLEAMVHRVAFPSLSGAQLTTDNIHRVISPEGPRYLPFLAKVGGQGEGDEQEWVEVQVHDGVARQLFANIPASCVLAAPTQGRGVRWDEWVVALVHALNEGEGCLARLHIHINSDEEMTTQGARYILGGCTLLDHHQPPDDQAPT